MIFVGLIVACVTISVSAFVNKKKHFHPGDRYVQTSLGVYELISVTYDPDQFCDLSPNPCSFLQQYSDVTNYGPIINLSTILAAPPTSFKPTGMGEYYGPLTTP